MDEEIEFAGGDQVLAQRHGQRSRSGLSGNNFAGKFESTKIVLNSDHSNAIVRKKL